ncbi:hypothetical protein AC1031_016238 [Aphanomyces cochlioides]|nr:hypothetical protein AC1031_016238 [Aphanomyces cochlioides]
MARLAPYRMKIPDLVKERIDMTLSTTMYLVQTSGPTNYVIQEQNSNKKHRVLIGSVQSCSCGDKEICCHILFVMIKILRVPATNPVVWQRSLIDSETNMVLTGGYCQSENGGARKTFLRRKLADPTAPSSQPGTNEVQARECARHALVEGEVCAICQEEMVEAQQNLTYCKRGCGNNFHIDCMKIFGESRKQSKENIICPLCRQDWGDSALTKLKKEADVANRNPLVHTGTTCKQCQTKPIRCQRYRCLQCKHVDLCERCFKSNAHTKHSFVMRKAHKGTWFPALRSVRSSILSPESVRALEGRELSNADYDMLLELDAAEKCPLQDYLMANLVGTKIPATEAKAWTPARNDGITWCTLCSQSLRIPTHIRGLPCEHTFHESCLLQHVLAQRYKCPNDDCDHVLFPGLYHATDGKKTTAPNAHQPTEPQTKATLPSLGLVSVVSLMKKPGSNTVEPLNPLAPPHRLPAMESTRRPKPPRTKELPRGNNQLEDCGLLAVGMIKPPSEVRTTSTPTPHPPRLPSITRRTPQTAPESLAPSLVAGNPHLSTLPSLVVKPEDSSDTTLARLAHADNVRLANRAQSQERKRKQATAAKERKMVQKVAMEQLGQLTLGPVAQDLSCDDRQQRVAQAAADKVQKQKEDRELRHRLAKERRDNLDSNNQLLGMNL